MNIKTGLAALSMMLPISATSVKSVAQNTAKQVPNTVVSDVMKIRGN